jgi:hypothetical protein
VDRSKYLELQFQTLRQEIEHCLDRAFKLMIGGATLIPILIGTLARYSATAILMVFPMVIVVMVLLYLNQWHSVMRCGRYIRTNIERDILGNDGWEAWLEMTFEPELGHLNNRRVDTYLVNAFSLLSAAYYFASCYIAISYASNAYGPISAWITVAGYTLIGLVMSFILLRRVPTSTTTQHELAARSVVHHAPGAADTPNAVVASDKGVVSSGSTSGP